MPGTALRHLPLLLLLFANPAVVRADALSDLPEALASRLQPVPEVSVDMLNQDARDQLTQARKTVLDVLAQQENDAELADAYGELGALYQVQHVYTAADLCYRNARTLAPGNFRWTYLHGYLADVNGETRQAIELYEAARQIRPDYLAVTLRLADAWLDLNEQDRAAAAYREVEGERGLQAAAAYGLGQVALLQRDHAAAIDHFEQALALQPEANRIHYSLATALRASGRDEEARTHLQQLGDRQPVITDPLVDSLQSLERGSRVYFSQAMKASRKRDYAAARDAFARGLEREPDNRDARISYARTLYLTDDSAGAEKELLQVLAQAPDNTLARYLLGVLTEEAGDAAAATDHYRQVLKREPAHAGANFYLANQLYRSGQPDEAARHYATTLASDAENFAAYPAYAGVLLQTGGNPGPVIATALQRFPDQPMLRLLELQLLACTDKATGCDARRALTDAKALVEQQPMPPHRELLALAQAASGDFAAAIELQQSLESDAVWMAPTETTRLHRVLGAYEDGRLPAPQDLFTWQILQPPRTRAADVFRDYPTLKPY